MGEIKFRMWYKSKNEMLDVEMIDFKNKHYYMENYDKWLRSYLYEDEIELMQYTCLKDKNGKEIYEGDIVRTFKGDMCIVEYNYNGFGLKVIDKSKCYGWVDFIGYKIEVIGNIYENTDLLVKE